MNPSPPQPRIVRTARALGHWAGQARTKGPNLFRGVVSEVGAALLGPEFRAMSLDRHTLLGVLRGIVDRRRR